MVRAVLPRRSLYRLSWAVSSASVSNTSSSHITRRNRFKSAKRIFTNLTTLNALVSIILIGAILISLGLFRHRSVRLESAVDADALQPLGQTCRLTSTGFSSCSVAQVATTGDVAWSSIGSGLATVWQRPSPPLFITTCSTNKAGWTAVVLLGGYTSFPSCQPQGAQEIAGMALLETTARGATGDAFLLTVFADMALPNSTVDVGSDGSTVAVIEAPHRLLITTNGSTAVDDQNGTTSAQTISPLGNHFLISSSAYSVVLDLSATPSPRGGSFVGRDSKKVVCFAWSVGHVVANWEGLFALQLVMVAINGIFFGADFVLTNQGLQGFIAKKPILTYDLSAGTERRKAVLVLSGLDCLLSSHYINVGRIYHGSSFGAIVFLFSALILATCWEAFTHVALAFISCIPCPFTHIVSYNPRLLVFGIIISLPFVYWSQYEAMSREFHQAPFGLALNISGTLRPSGAYVDAPVPTIALHMFPYCYPTIFGVILLAVAESMGQRKRLYGVFLLDVSWTKTNGFLSCCGVPGWITGIALDAQNAIKIGNKLFVKPSLQVVLGYATIVPKAASDATGTDAARDDEHTTMTIVSVYDLLPSLLGFHKWLPPWATPKPFGTITEHEFHPRTDLMLAKDAAYVHDRGTCVN